jgi:hypothetical protein
MSIIVDWLPNEMAPCAKLKRIAHSTGAMEQSRNLPANLYTQYEFHKKKQVCTKWKSVTCSNVSTTAQ